MNLTERIRERFEAREARLNENPRSANDRDAMAILADAHRWSVKADKYRERKEGNTRAQPIS